MISLIRTQLIVLMNLNDLRDRKKRFKVLGIIALIALGLSPSYIGFIVSINKAYKFAGTYQLPADMILSGMYSLAQIMVLLLGLPMVLSTLMRSRDLSILLPLPYTPVQIIASKMSIAYLSELAIAVLFLLPTFVINALYMHPGIGQILNGILCILTLPVIPLAVCSILTMFVTNIPGIGRNKWFYHLATMACVLIVVLSINTFSYTDTAHSMDMIRLKMQQSSQLAKMLPGSIFGVRALALPGLEGLLNQALNIVVVCAYTALLLLAAGRLYIKPIILGDYTKRSRARRVETFKARSFMMSCVRKELTGVLKDPAVAMNGLGGYIAMPFMLLTYAVMKVQTKGQVDVIGSLMRFVNGSHIPELVPLLVVGLALVLVFFGSSGSTLFAATYSKDGKRLWIEKSLPVDPFTVFKSKLLAAAILVSIFNAATILAFAWILRLSLLPVIYIFVLSEIMIICSGAIGMLIDCRRPKVEWKEIIQAVKHNINVMIAFAASLLLMVLNLLMLYGFYKFHMPALGVYAVTLAVNAVLLAFALASARRLSQGLNDVVV